MRAYSVIKTPLGPITIGTDGKSLTYCSFSSPGEKPEPKRGSPELKFLRNVEDKLRRYFEGDAAALDDLALAPEGSDFQREVWKELRRIPFGKTRSYGEIAARVGRPGASRAVGTACGKNPLVLFVPCHRVLASGGKIGGFSAGLKRKEFLLKLEGIETRAS